MERSCSLGPLTLEALQPMRDCATALLEIGNFCCLAGTGDFGEPIGKMPDLITRELACPDVNGELVEPAEFLGGVKDCAKACPIPIALSVCAGNFGGLPCRARHMRFLSRLEMCHAYPLHFNELPWGLL